MPLSLAPPVAWSAQRTPPSARLSPCWPSAPSFVSQRDKTQRATNNSTAPRSCSPSRLRTPPRPRPRRRARAAAGAAAARCPAARRGPRRRRPAAGASVQERCPARSPPQRLEAAAPRVRRSQTAAQACAAAALQPACSPFFALPCPSLPARAAQRRGRHAHGAGGLCCGVLDPTFAFRRSYEKSASCAPVPACRALSDECCARDCAASDTASAAHKAPARRRRPWSGGRDNALRLAPAGHGAPSCRHQCGGVCLVHVSVGNKPHATGRKPPVRLAATRGPLANWVLGASVARCATVLASRAPCALCAPPANTDALRAR